MRGTRALPKAWPGRPSPIPSCTWAPFLSPLARGEDVAGGTPHHVAGFHTSRVSRPQTKRLMAALPPSSAATSGQKPISSGTARMYSHGTTATTQATIAMLQTGGLPNRQPASASKHPAAKPARTMIQFISPKEGENKFRLCSSEGVRLSITSTISLAVTCSAIGQSATKPQTVRTADTRGLRSGFMPAPAPSAPAGSVSPWADRLPPSSSRRKPLPPPAPGRSRD